MYQEGLVDSNNQEDFESHLENCRSAWIAREARYQREGQIRLGLGLVPRGPKVGTSSCLRSDGDGHSAPPTMTDASCLLHSDTTHSVVSDNVVGVSSYNVFQSPPNMLSAATTI